MKVYGLTESWAPGGYDPVTCGIFSTREKAEEVKKKCEENPKFKDAFVYDIEEWEVDKE